MVKIMLNQPYYNTKNCLSQSSLITIIKSWCCKKAHELQKKKQKKKKTALTSTYHLSSRFNIYLPKCENCEKHFHRFRYLTVENK